LKIPKRPAIVAKLGVDRSLNGEIAVNGRRTFHWAWVILGICFADLFINYSVRLGYGVVLPEMIRTLGFNRAAGGTIINSYLLVYITITPLTGYLTDRLGARRVITVCLMILGTGVLLMGSVQNLGMACLFFAITGLGATGLWAPVLTLAQRWFAHHRRGFALGIMSTGYGLGFATMGAVFPLIVERLNWRYAWFFLGVGALVMVLANAFFLRSDPENIGLQPWGQKETPQPQVTGIPPGAKPISLKTLFYHPVFWLIGFSYLAIAYSLYGMTTFMVDYARYQLGFPLEKASFLAAIHGLCQIVGVLTILPLSDYLGRKKTITISNTIITVALLGIVVVGKSWTALCILIGLLAIFYGVTFPIYGACAGDYFPRGSIGTVIGAWTPLYGCGAIAANWITGMLRDATGTYNHAFFINVVMAAAAIVFISFVKKK
jgi:sugar phosphate permease